MVRDGDRVVEEHHHPVAREVLQGPLVRRDQLAERAVVLAQHVEQLLRRGGLGEGREAAQVAEQARDVGAVSGQEPLAVAARTSSATWGETKRESSVRCRSTASISRAFAIAIAAWSAKVWTSAMCSSVNGCCFSRTTVSAPISSSSTITGTVEHRPVRSRAGVRVLRILLDVGDVHRLARDGRASGGRRPVERMRMRAVVRGGFGEAVVRGRVEKPVLEEVERTLIGLGQAPAGPDHLVEDRLQAA